MIYTGVMLVVYHYTIQNVYVCNEQFEILCKQSINVLTQTKNVKNNDWIDSI